MNILVLTVFAALVFFGISAYRQFRKRASPAPEPAAPSAISSFVEAPPLPRPPSNDEAAKSLFPPAVETVNERQVARPAVDSQARSTRSMRATGDGVDVFLSYASADRSTAEQLAAALAARGWSVWWDRTILPGKSYDQVIEAALDSAKCVVVLWSKASVASDWVKNEASEGSRREILIPAVIEQVTAPLEFRRIQAASLLDWKPSIPHSGFDALTRAVTGLVGRSDTTGSKEAHEGASSDARVLDVQVHRAFFSGHPMECHFINLCNLSPNRVLEVTHVWYEDETHHIPIVNDSRPLPVRLDLDQSWETWIESRALPAQHREHAFERFRARTSNGQVFASRMNLTVPPIGTVPGG